LVDAVRSERKEVTAWVYYKRLKSMV
jgi:hypothetical protein